MEKTRRFELKHIVTLLIIFVAIILGLVVYMRNRENAYVQATENNYNQAFYELVSYVQNVESYLAKSMISTTPEHGAETLTHVWREANLAQTYLAQLPLNNNELSNTAKFLNQVSDYSYSLSRKNIYNEELTQEELDNLKNLHDYSVELENTLNQLSNEMFDGRLTWSELTREENINLAQQVSNISQDSFRFSRRKFSWICRFNLWWSFFWTHNICRKKRFNWRRNWRRKSKTNSSRIYWEWQNRRSNIKWIFWKC